jgi:formamidopyrimidine-DNA glycosylase
MELPEITILARQMDEEMAGKRIAEVDVANEKCLNMPLEGFREIAVGRKVSAVAPRGKWVFTSLSPGYTLLFNTGMGADVIHFKPGGELPEKYHIRIGLDDGSGFTARVWWFCYLHLVPNEGLREHKLTRGMGLTPLDEGFTQAHLTGLLEGRRGGIKSFLLNQRTVAGIGNVYIQDILFKARLHPLRKINTLTEGDIRSLHRSMREVLRESIGICGLAYERDFYGNRGGYGKEQYRVAYKPGEPCPRCGTTIEIIKTGSTSSFICPDCQTITCSGA